MLVAVGIAALVELEPSALWALQGSGLGSHRPIATSKTWQRKLRAASVSEGPKPHEP